MGWATRYSDRSSQAAILGPKPIVTLRRDEAILMWSVGPMLFIWPPCLGEKLWKSLKRWFIDYLRLKPEHSHFSTPDRCELFDLENWKDISGTFHSFSPILRVHTKAPGRSEAPYLVSVSLTVTHKTVLLISDLGWLGDYPCAVKKGHDNCSWTPENHENHTLTVPEHNRATPRLLPSRNKSNSPAPSRGLDVAWPTPLEC